MAGRLEAQGEGPLIPGKKGDVFTDDQIDAYMDLKWDEGMTYETAPHPIEFMMYYSV